MMRIVSDANSAALESFRRGGKRPLDRGVIEWCSQAIPQCDETVAEHPFARPDQG